MPDALTTRYPIAVGALRLAGQVVQAVLGPRHDSELPGPDGVIDFKQRRSVHSHGAFWRLIADGQDYTGHPGEWEVGPRDSLTEEDPFWLWALLANISEVTTEADEAIRGVRCHRYDAVADFHRARATCSQELAVPRRSQRQDLARLPVHVWVDPEGRVRDVVYWGKDGSETRIELSDHGVPNSVEIPRDHELVPDDAY